jgi:Carboxypeptidase regulatory-like domain
MFGKRSLLAVTLLLLCASTLPAAAQSITSGDITGVVIDPSGAVLPGVTVTLKNNATGATQTHSTTDQGVYRFSLLNPGSYTVSVQAGGFQQRQETASVSVGQATTLNFKLAVTSSSQTVEVNGEGIAVDTQSADVSTSFSPTLVAQAPDPGNDLSYVLQQAPGAVMNTQSGYGNASTFGLPATSNVFTVNGSYENDPFLNLNNSGATNLLLGKNDIQEVTVVNNGYSGQYGGLAGAQVNYVTKSGSNQWHGNALYWWNGRKLNANNYFNNQSGTPRPFDNVNQWAASFGGPIRKDKTFFYVNNEGIRVVLPTSMRVNVPSPEFQAATLANLSATGNAASIPFYQRMFSLWKGAPGSSGAQNTLPNGGCTDAFTLSNGAPCALEFQSTAGNQSNEWLLTARVDQNIGNADRLFVHFRTDHGQQATFTDPINPAFNAQSNQPQYEAQVQETHTFGATAVNQFIASGSWYSAKFGPQDLAAATALMPFRVAFAGNTFASLGRNLNVWPQGRNVTQYGIVDDFSWTKGHHTLKVGVNFRRNDITDFSPGVGSIGISQGEDLTSFFNGEGVSYVQNFPVRQSQPVALYALGFYGQDEWQVRNNLKLTLALRADHNSNPVCQTNCFARFSGSFLDGNHDPNTPYDQTIQTGLNQAFLQYTNISWQPRIGFVYSPFGLSSTVIRGGFGLFTDAFPATIADLLLNNAPINNQFVTNSAPLSPDTPGNQASLAAQANAAFLQGFANGQTFAQIQAANPLFVPPSFYNIARHIYAPQYQQWNFSVEHAFDAKTTLSVNYVGNHGVHLAVQNPGLNAFFPTGLGDLPLAPTDQRFGTITEASTTGRSNYNGVTAAVRRRFSSLELQANYTWSHALDDVSNGGFLQYGILTNQSVLSPQDPFNLRRFNYGNADYDTRHYLSLSYVWNVPHFRGPRRLVDDWVISGTVFARSGVPFTVVDGNQTALLSEFNYGGNLNGAGAFVFANSATGAPISCNSDAVSTPCLNSSEFTPATTGFGNQRRNQVYGPRYVNTDLAVSKNFRLPRWESAKLGVGAQFFNLFNHPNFDQPVGDIASQNFGSIISTVNTPTSILGAFLGGDASPRQIQLKASLIF